MSPQALDEDGFHSIAWEDAPPRPILHDVSATSPLSEDGEGFENISSSSPPPVESVARNPTAKDIRGTRKDATGEVNAAEWGGRWMSIEVKDPVKEHEGSKDTFVSYAVRTKVGLSAVFLAVGFDAVHVLCICHVRVQLIDCCADQCSDVPISWNCRPPSIPRLRLPPRTPRQELPCLCRASYPRQTSVRSVCMPRVFKRFMRSMRVLTANRVYQGGPLLTRIRRTTAIRVSRRQPPILRARLIPTLACKSLPTESHAIPRYNEVNSSAISCRAQNGCAVILAR